MKTIIFDFNGTLINDLDVSVDILNKMRNKRAMLPVSKEAYLELFGFPVRHYYEAVGFDFQKEGFDLLSHEFIQHYNQEVKKATLFPRVSTTLRQLKKEGHRLVVLSAAEKGLLNKLLKQHHIASYFETILGLDNIYAHSKIDVAKDYFQAKNRAITSLYLIGDTLHDYEVAQELKCTCILVANGHQSKKRLQTSGAIVVDDIQDILQYIR